MHEVVPIAVRIAVAMEAIIWNKSQILLTFYVANQIIGLFFSIV